MRSFSKKAFSVFMAMVMAVLFTTFAVTDVQAASKKYELPATRTCYYYYDGSWYKEMTIKYKYNKYGQTTKANNSKIVWKNKNKKPVKATFGKKKNYVYHVKNFSKKGRIVSASYCKYNSAGKTESGFSDNVKYKYNKKGWISKATEKKTGTVMNYKYSFHKGGIPKKIKATVNGKNENWNNTYSVSKKGLITNITSIYNESFYNDSYVDKYRFSYSYDKKGRVKTIIIERMLNGKWEKAYKTTYTYKKYKTTNKKAYFTAINEINHDNGCFQDSVFRAVDDYSVWTGMYWE